MDRLGSSHLKLFKLDNTMSNKRVKSDTLSKYRRAYRQFLTFLTLGNLIIVSVDGLDAALVRYGTEVAETRGEFAMVFAALQFFHPICSKALCCSFQQKRGWDLDAQVKHTVPLVMALLWGTIRCLIRMGEARAAVGLGLQYGGLLRPGELCEMRGGDIILPEHHGYGCLIMLGLRTHGTKVKRQQTVEIKNAFFVAMARFMFRNTARDAPVLRLDYQQYGALLRRAWTLMGVDGLGLTPHSARAGGATNDLLNGVPFSTVQERGRWLHAQSCRIYLDRAQALSMQTVAHSQAFLALAQNPRLVGDVFAFNKVAT